MTTAMPRSILVAGATGKQGGALIASILRSGGHSPFQIYALTRNAKSAAALKLASQESITVIEGDMDDVPSIFKKLPSSLHGVFSVQTPLKPKVEEQQGKAMIDAASAHGVRRFVYTSADRGGPEVSDHEGTPVAHLRSKFNIENHLKTVTQTNKEMKWTIIRPVAFMDNLTDNFFGRVFATMWTQNGMDRKLQFVPAADIGILANAIFQQQNDEYTGKSISLATDELSPREADEIFQRVLGRPMPRTYDFTGRLIHRLAREQLGTMFDWFVSDGFGARPDEFTSQKQFKEMHKFEKWLREESQFAKTR